MPKQKKRKLKRLKVILVRKCRACESRNLFEFLNFGPMAIPNIYKTPKEIQTRSQMTFQLDANLCLDCGLVQLGQIVPPELLFAADYAYKTPQAMKKNFRQSTLETIAFSKAKLGDRVLEIGSNIGISLAEYKKRGLRVLGVDPAKIYAEEANKKGLETVIKPFNVSLAEDIISDRGKMKIVSAANVLQHIPDLRGTFEGIKKVLAPDGVFTLEFPYLGYILRNTDFDTFYHEHYFYFSLTPIQKILKHLGMTIVHAKRLPNIHCGSMRIFIKHKPSKISNVVRSIILKEKRLGFRNPNRYRAFERRVNNIMYQINEHLHIARTKGERVAAHGASAKFVTITNYGHIGPRQILYVADSTPLKQGKLTPGMAIPIVPEEYLLKDAPDIVFNGIRNFYNQNKKKYQKIKERNPKARILMPIPKVHFL